MSRTLGVLKSFVPKKFAGPFLECRKWGFKRWGFKENPRTSEEKGLFPPFFWISQVLLAPSGKGRKMQKKGDFGRFRPISRKSGRTPLKPPFVTPPFAASQLFRDFFQTLQTFSRCVPDSLGSQGQRPGRFFSDFFGVSGPEGPRDPCKWPTGSQLKSFVPKKFVLIFGPMLLRTGQPPTEVQNPQPHPKSARDSLSGVICANRFR